MAKLVPVCPVIKETWDLYSQERRGRFFFLIKKSINTDHLLHVRACAKNYLLQCYNWASCYRRYQDAGRSDTSGWPDTCFPPKSSHLNNEQPTPNRGGPETSQWHTSCWAPGHPKSISRRTENNEASMTNEKYYFVQAPDLDLLLHFNNPQQSAHLPYLKHQNLMIFRAKEPKGILFSLKRKMNNNFSLPPHILTTLPSFFCLLS